MSTATLISVERYAAMPQDEAVRHELVEGELVERPSPTSVHAWIRAELRGAIREFLRREKIGLVLDEVDCRTVGETVRCPDIAFFTRARLELMDLRRVPLPFAPDIAVEVLSPSERAIDVNRKICEYLSSGSGEVWILDSENAQIQIHTASGVRRLSAGDSLESPLLPGFSIPVTEALASPL